MFSLINEDRLANESERSCWKEPGRFLLPPLGKTHKCWLQMGYGFHWLSNSDLRRWCCCWGLTEWKLTMADAICNDNKDEDDEVARSPDFLLSWGDSSLRSCSKDWNWATEPRFFCPVETDCWTDGWIHRWIDTVDRVRRHLSILPLIPSYYTCMCVNNCSESCH